MTMQEYQDAALTTAIFPGRGEFLGLTYCALGLNGEAGEVADKLKKIQRDKGFVIQGNDREALKAELGDCLWYLAICAYELGLTLENVAESNIAKLKDRMARGMLGGSGDFR